MSTREASALSTWKAPRAGNQAAESAGKLVQKLKRPAGAAQTYHKPAAPAPPPDPLQLKTARLKASRNFDSDSDTEADKSTPDAYSQALSKIQQQVSKQEKEAAATRPQKARPPASTHAQQQKQYSPGNASHAKQHANSHKSRVVLPKGKAGAASRQMALAPQVILDFYFHLQATDACHVMVTQHRLPPMPSIAAACT